LSRGGARIRTTFYYFLLEGGHVGRFATAQSGVEPCGLRIGGLSKLEAQNLEDPRQKNAPLMSVICDQKAIAEDARMIGRGGGDRIVI
jgi:hypothetical protein